MFNKLTRNQNKYINFILIQNMNTNLQLMSARLKTKNKVSLYQHKYQHLSKKKVNNFVHLKLDQFCYSISKYPH